MAVINFYFEERRNKRRSFFLIALFITTMGLFGLLVDSGLDSFPWFTAAFLILALGQVLLGIYFGPKMVLNSVGAKIISSKNREHRELHNILNELCVASGWCPPPKVYYIPKDPNINAFATGVFRDDSYICVTEGLLETLGRVETQGVIAHELSHIQHRDTLYMTLISSILGATMLIKSISFEVLRGSFSRKDDSEGISFGCSAMFFYLFFVWILAAIFSFLGRILLFAILRSREYLADAHAVELTRNPFGLSQALRKIAIKNIRNPKASLAIAHLFISDPLKRAVNERSGFWADLFSTHPPIHLRIAKLENKAPQMVLQELEEEFSSLKAPHTTPLNQKEGEQKEEPREV